MIELDDQGGAIPENSAELLRAENADLGTLPEGITGTNCGNCKFVAKVKSINAYVNDKRISQGYCKHPVVRQSVTSRMCCVYWDHEGFIRHWEE